MGLKEVFTKIKIANSLQNDSFYVALATPAMDGTFVQ